MPHFESARDYWTFQHSVKNEARYVRTKQAEEFLKALSKSAKEQEQQFQLDKGRLLWRAQLGHGWSPMFDNDGNQIEDAEEIGPHEPDRMKPIAGQATEGRANSKGIPCLYLAIERDTALSEIRPGLTMSISAAQFETTRELQLIVFVSEGSQKIRYLVKEPPPEDRDEFVWQDIDRAFSRPITPTDTSADYAPTQIIAEMFKSEGFDGIAYRSAFTGGYNVALFDINSAKLVNCCLYEAKNLSYTFEQSGNPYTLGSNEPQGNT